MSEFIRALNRIKAQRDSSWLTDSQHQALGELKDALRAPGTVNLCGSIGVGKTFLAWTLADELSYVYYPHLSLFEQSNDVNVVGVILDNSRPGRQAHREILKTLHFRGVRQAVIVTRRLIQDYTHYVELTLTQADIDKVRSNLATVGLFSQPAEVSSLWHLINSCL